MLKKTALIYFLFVFLTSCHPVGSMDEFSNLTSISDNSPVECPSAASFHQNKVLFVIDKTRTNKKSDPGGSLREKGVKHFIENHKGQNMSFSFIAFSTKPSSPLTVHNIPVFKSNAEEIDSAVQSVFSLKDEGKKNYSELFPWIQKTIENDIRLGESLLSDYFIIFISDGYPAVSAESQNQFIQNMNAFSQRYRNVSINSAYYGDYKNRRAGGLGQAFSRLTNTAFNTFVLLQTGVFMPMMAVPPAGGESIPAETASDDTLFVQSVSENGRGRYLDYNKGSFFDFRSQFVKSWNVEFFLVYNLNAGFCADGYVGVDSDGDGLCDQDEERMEGFRSDSRFSFQDGYGDYFHYFALKRKKTLPACLERTDSDHDLLTVCEENYLNIIYKNRPSLKPLSPKNPDSDGDGIIDGIEAMVYLTRATSAPLNPDNLKQIHSGRQTDFDKITRHISPFAPSEEQISYDTMLTPLEGQNSKTCYGLKQNTLPLYPTQLVNKEDTLSGLGQKEGENRVLIYFLQKNSGSNDFIYQFKIENFEWRPGESHQNPLQIPVNDSRLHPYPFKAEE